MVSSVVVEVVTMVDVLVGVWVVIVGVVGVVELKEEFVHAVVGVVVFCVVAMLVDVPVCVVSSVVVEMVARVEVIVGVWVDIVGVVGVVETISRSTTPGPLQPAPLPPP